MKLETPNSRTEAGLVESGSVGRICAMKGLAATAVFLVQGALLAGGVVMAANGKGFALLVVALAVLGGLFVKFGCIDNAPKH